MSIHFLTLATSNWKKSRQQLLQQIQQIQNQYSYFKTIDFLDETNLSDEYMQVFSKYLDEYGYGMWSWKPFIILEKLKTLATDDILLYADCGCRFENNSLTTTFLALVCFYANIMQNTNKAIAIGYNKFSKCMNSNIIVQVHKNTLEKFNLIDNFNFLIDYNHYEAGIFFIRKCNISMQLIEQWYQFFVKNYEYCFYKNRLNKNGQYPQYIANNGDQSVLQCLLYTKFDSFKFDVHNMFYDYKIYQRIKN